MCKTKSCPLCWKWIFTSFATLRVVYCSAICRKWYFLLAIHIDKYQGVKNHFWWLISPRGGGVNLTLRKLDLTTLRLNRKLEKTFKIPVFWEFFLVFLKFPSFPISPHVSWKSLSMGWISSLVKLSFAYCVRQISKVLSKK